MSESYCGLGRAKIYRLMEALQQAIIKNDTSAIEQAKLELQKYRELCGSPLNDEQIKSLVGINTLEPTERQFINEAPQLVLRSLTNGNLREAITDFARFRNYIKPIAKKFTLRGFIKYEILPDGNLKLVVPEQSKPKIPEPISDVQIALRQIQSDKKQLTDFQEILGRNFRPTEPAMHAKMTLHKQRLGHYSILKGKFVKSNTTHKRTSNPDNEG